MQELSGPSSTSRPRLKQTARPYAQACLDKMSTYAIMAGYRLTRRQRSNRIVVLASPGGFNTGDQAMLESIRENFAAHPVTVLVGNPAAYDLTGPLKDVSIVNVSDVIHKNSIRRIWQALCIGMALGDAEIFGAVGADVMDGGYSLQASVRTWRLCAGVVRLGVPTRVFGFSWKPGVSGAVADAAQSAVNFGVRALLRDPQSLGRFKSDTDADCELVADVVFAMKGRPAMSQDLFVAEVSSKAAGKPIAVVNVSALVGRHANLPAEYAPILDALDAAGMAIILVPHVTHPNSDDRQATRLVVDGVDLPEGSNIVERLLTIQEERELLRQAQIVVTGRMHLAVLSLTEGVPPVVLSTQGKVSGLLEMFGLHDLAVEPSPGFGEVVASRIRSILEARSSTTTQIASRLDRVVTLSEANFLLTGSTPQR